MILSDFARGFVGVFVVAACGLGPSFITRTATARVLSHRPAHGATAPVGSERVERESPAHLALGDVPEPAPVPEADPVAEAPKPAAAPKRAIATTIRRSKARAEKSGAEKGEASEAGRETNTLLLGAAVRVRIDEIDMCRRPGGPEGRGRAHVDFYGDGTARVQLAPPYAGTAVGACVARRIGAAAMPFEGSPIGLRVDFEL